MFFSAFVFAFLYLWINLRQAARNSFALPGDGRAGRPAPLAETDALAQPGIDFSPRLLQLAVGVISAGVALFFAVGFYGQWDTYLRFRYGGSFGVADPLFGIDAGFYIFHLPFYQMLQTSLMLLTVLALAAVVLTNAFFGRLRANGSGTIALGGKATSQLSVLLFILVANWGWALPRSLQPRLLHSGRRLWSRLCRGSCDEDHPVDHGRHFDGGVRAAGAQLLPPAIQSAPRRIRHLCRAVCRRNLAGPLCLSEVLRATERAGTRDTLSEELHRVHPQGLSARFHPGNLLSGLEGPDARGACKE